MDKKEHIFDNPKNIKRLLRIFYVCCGLLISLDLVFHRHTVHPWEGFPGFYAFYGLIACVILVLVAKEMRKVVMRDENYYQKGDLNNKVDNGNHHER